MIYNANRYTQNDYKEIIKNEYDGFNAYIDNVSYVLDAKQRLIFKFYEFINILISKEKSKRLKKSLILNDT